MVMLADLVDVVIGVDTHKHTHTAAIVQAATIGGLPDRSCLPPSDGRAWRGRSHPPEVARHPVDLARRMIDAIHAELDPLDAAVAGIARHQPAARPCRAAPGSLRDRSGIAPGSAG